MHDLIVVGIPVLAIIIGIFYNQHGLSALEGRLETRFASIDARFNGIDARFNSIEERLDGMQRDMHEFYRILGDHGARIERLEKRA